LIAPQAGPLRLRRPPAQIATPQSQRSLGKMPEILLIAGLLLLPLQAVQISISQPGHLWVVVSLLVMFHHKVFRISRAEIVALLLFLAFAAILTYLQDFYRIKEFQQFLKFAFIYPAMYFVGRWLGVQFGDQPLPLGYKFLFAFLLFQYFVQTFELPVIYREFSFAGGTLNGTFMEKNWLSLYFFLFSYVLLLKDDSKSGTLLFFALNAVVGILAPSKGTLIACGIVFLFLPRVPNIVKIVAIVGGALLYATVLSDTFDGASLSHKLESERGAALDATMNLVAENPLGYGFGFIEG
jgi:hypothetical protein